MIWEASSRWASPRPASTSCTWPAAGARSAASPCRRSTADAGVRHGRGHVSGGAGDRCRHDHLRAGPQRAGVHLPAAGRVHHQRAGRLHIRRLAGPVFVQGDHYQFNAKKYAADADGHDRDHPEGRPATPSALATETSTSIRRRWSTCRCRRSMTSSAPTTSAPRRCRRSSARSSPRTSPISIGGEIGEVGKQNSTEEELRAYLDGYRHALDRLAGARARAIQGQRPDGHLHGGVPLPGGGVAEVALDFGTLERLSVVAREYGIGRCRPARRLHPARRAVPPLPAGRDGGDPPRDRASRTCSTTTRRFPPELLREIEDWCCANTADERKAGESDDVSSCTRRARRRSARTSASCGSCRRRTRSSPSQEAKLALPVRAAAVAGTREMVERYMRPAPRVRCRRPRRSPEVGRHKGLNPAWASLDLPARAADRIRAAARIALRRRVRPQLMVKDLSPISNEVFPRGQRPSEMRRPAQLGLVQSFLNTVDLTDRDDLADPCRHAVVACGAPPRIARNRVRRKRPPPADRVRRAVNGLVAANGGDVVQRRAVTTLNEAARRVRLGVRLHPEDGYRLMAEGVGIDRPIGELLISVTDRNGRRQRGRDSRSVPTRSCQERLLRWSRTAPDGGARWPTVATG